ncbi:exo-alpha-sialidase [Candidatus Sumerlaeota bacterium]|nr:exo-alpha-sialidase [Candidatus Sumerlaeota bacterium]
MPRITFISAVLIWLCALTATAAGGEIEIQRVFGPEVPGKYKHPASIAQLANGDLYLVYYGGAGEYATDTAVFGSRLKKGEKKWEPPKAVADTPLTADGNGVIWQAPDGWVWLFYVVRYGETWSTSRIKAKISYDGAQTWTDPLDLSFEEGSMVRNKPIVLMNGEYLLPIYHETGKNTEFTGPDSTSRFLRFNPKEKKWKPSGEIKSAKGNIQPGAVQIEEKNLIAYCRRGGDYEPTTIGYIVRAESHDGGFTWSEGKDSPFPNPNAAVEFMKLKNGHLLLIYNNSMNARTPLTAAISTDNDKSWPYKRDIIADPKGDFGYPFAIEGDDGKIHLIFTSEERTVVNHAVFDEGAILNGR